MKVFANVPLFLFLINFLFRLSLISKGPYHADCLFLAVQAENTLNTWQIQYLQGSGLPLTVILGAIFIGLLKIFGLNDPVWAVNFMNVTLSSLCASVMYILTKNTFNKEAGVIAALLLSANPIILAVSEFGNSHIPCLLFFLVGLTFLLLHIDKESPKNLILSALCFGLMGAARLQDLIPVLIPLSYILVSANKSKNTTKQRKQLFLFLFLITLTVIIFYIPLFMYRSNNSLMIKNLSYYFRLIPDSLNKTSFAQFETIIKWILSSLSLVGCVASILGLRWVYKYNHKFFIFLLLWLLLPTVLFGCFWQSSPRIYIIPAVSLILPIGYLFSDLFRGKKLWHSLSLFLLAISAIFNVAKFYPTIQFRHDHAMLSDFYKWIASVTEPNAHILERDHSLFIRYYSQRIPLTNPITTLSMPYEKLTQFQEEVDRLIQKKIPVYITYTGLNGYPPQFKKEFQTLVNKHYHLEKVGEKYVEEWYNGCLQHSQVYNALYRIKKHADESGIP